VETSAIKRKRFTFFDKFFDKGWEWYFNHFPNDCLNVDCTPAYCLLSKKEVLRVKENIPNAKIVLVLRNPVERAISVAKANVMWYPYTIARFSDLDRMLKCAKRIAKAQRSNYPRMIRNWRKAYGNQFYLYYFDDLVASPEKFSANLCNDLGVVDDGTVIAVSNRSPERLTIDPRVEQWLADHFEPKIKSWN